MTGTTAALKAKIAALEDRIEDRFLELARALRAPQKSDPGAFAQVFATSVIGRRLAYYLVSIGRAFDGLPVVDARLEQIGWTKLAIIAPHVGLMNVGELLDLAEDHTAFELQGFADDMPRQEDHCVLLRMTEADYALFLDVMTAFGATRKGRGLANKEKALRALLTAATATNCATDEK